MNSTTVLTAEVRDWLHLEPRRPGETRRTGQVVEILGDPGFELYRVRWPDGATTLVRLDDHVTVCSTPFDPDEPVLVHEP